MIKPKDIIVKTRRGNLNLETVNKALAYFMQELLWFERGLEDQGLILYPRLMIMTGSEKKALNVRYGQDYFSEMQVKCFQKTGHWLEEASREELMNTIFGGPFG